MPAIIMIMVDYTGVVYTWMSHESYSVKIFTQHIHIAQCDVSGVQYALTLYPRATTSLMARPTVWSTSMRSQRIGARNVMATSLDPQW